jgi:nicotinamide-nucleotide amidase
MEAVLEEIAKECGMALFARGWTLAAAESCTGGWICQAMTALPGSSKWFDRGFVTYTNAAKQDSLGVSARTLREHGAVSAATVCEMAAGALERSGAAISVAVSGIAGPDGGTEEKPVGTVWFAWAVREAGVHSRRCYFSGDREAVRRQSVVLALQEITRLAANETGGK